jgi:hypothetical protein
MMEEKPMFTKPWHEWAYVAALFLMIVIGLWLAN